MGPFRLVLRKPDFVAIKQGWQQLASKPAHPHSLFVPVWKVQKVFITHLITPKVLTYRGYLLFWGKYQIYFIECGEKK